MLKFKFYPSYHPAGISKISDFDSNGLSIARVQWVDQEICSSGSDCKGRKCKSVSGAHSEQREWEVKYSDVLINLYYDPGTLWLCQKMDFMSCLCMRTQLFKILIPLGRCDPRGDPEAGGLDNKKNAVGGLEMMLVSH